MIDEEMATKLRELLDETERQRDAYTNAAEGNSYAFAYGYIRSGLNRLIGDLQKGSRQ